VRQRIRAARLCLAMVGTRQRGGTSVKDLFRLDDPPTHLTSKPNPPKKTGSALPRTAPSGARARAIAKNPKPSGRSGRKQEGVAADGGGGHRGEDGGGGQGVGGHGAVKKLTKHEWKRVVQIKMIGHWEDNPEVETFKIEYPTVADPYYFWLHWDTPLGRQGLDKCGYQVSDLNKFLLAGKLVFKVQGASQMPYAALL
jgi:hypothetical protein